MKPFYILLSIIFLNIPAFAQQSSKQDDALLLEYYQNQRFDDAFNYLKKNYPEPVTDIKILSGLGYTAQMAGKLPEAITYYTRVYAADTTNTAILSNLGSINARRGDYKSAIGYYKKLLLKDSSNFNVYRQMGTLSQNNGSFKDAIYYFEKANKIKPTDGGVAYDLSSYYINQKLYFKADSIISIALQADSTNMTLLLGKGQCDYQLQKYPETIKVCNSLLQGGMQVSIVYSMLGTSYFNTKAYKLCIETFKLMEDSQTASETSYYYTAMSYKALGNQPLAIQYLEKAIKEATSGNVDSYYSEIGDSYDKLHRLKNSIAAYQKSLLYDIKPITYYALANLYDSELKDKQSALKYYKKYIAAKPPEKQQSYLAFAKSRVNVLGR
jgi:tetratricopeptide (TPR) repeat protein